MANPKLDLHDSTGSVIASNDDWKPSSKLPPTLVPRDRGESILTVTLPPGAYSAVLQGASSDTGIALFELYDIDTAHSSVANISTRGRIGTGDAVMIGGFMVGGDRTTKVIVRALGPSLTRQNVTGLLEDSTLELYDANGSLIFENDDWRKDQADQIIASSVAPTNDTESAIVAALRPGSYSAVVRGAGNSTGVALLEVYNLDL
jgi:type II secretory pathway component HofQ